MTATPTSGGVADERRSAGRLPDARLRGWHASGIALATVCTGALIVGAAGLLRGRRATTHHQNFDDLAAMGADVVRGRVVDDGDVVSAGGVTSGPDLALHLVEREAGRELAARVEHARGQQRRGC